MSVTLSQLSRNVSGLPQVMRLLLTVYVAAIETIRLVDGPASYLAPVAESTHVKCLKKYAVQHSLKNYNQRDSL